MTCFKNFRRKPVSFRRQLFVIFSVSGVLLAAIVSSVFAWTNSNTIRSIYTTEALQATRTLASMSELALLYDSAENAEDVAQATLGYPAIRHVMLINAAGRVILSKGDWHEAPLVFDTTSLLNRETLIVGESNNAMHFAAPVYTHSHSTHESDDNTLSDSGFMQDPLQQQPEYLGYVYLVQDLSEFKTSQYYVFLNNLLIGCLFSLSLIALLHISLKQLMRPLDKLSLAMRNTEKGNSQRLKLTHAPSELLSIGESFDKMIDALEQRDKQLREHNEQLENIVEKRTHELAQARDQALDASRQKSMFLATMSHELKTPLNSILGYSDMLKDELDQEGKFALSDDFDRIINNAEFLLDLINSILNIVKAESGRLKLDLTCVDLNALLEQVEINVRPLVVHNDNRLHIALTGSQTLVIIDAIKLRQILVNLLSNAAKFTQKGDITLKIRCSDNALLITVSDTGIGIDHDKLDSIFDPFRQIDSSLERRFDGSGLGLAISRYFCVLMGGQITVYSNKNQGSQFTVNIPLPISEDSFSDPSFSDPNFSDPSFSETA